MEKHIYKVTLEIEAGSENAVYKMLERTISDHRCFDFEIEDTEKKHFEERIRYVEDWGGDGEHFVFEGKWTDETDWSLDSAFKLLDYKNEKGVLIHYEALTKIREMMRNDVPFRFSK